MLQRNTTGLLGLVPRQGNQRGAGAHSHSQAGLGSCLSDPAALVSLDCKWHFPNQCCTHRASGRRQEPFCSFPMETTGIQAQHPQLCPRLLGEGLLTCGCSASAVWEGICRYEVQYQSSFPALCPGRGSPPLPSTPLPPLLANPASPCSVLQFQCGQGFQGHSETPPIPWPTLHPATFPFQTEIKYLFLLIKPPRQSPAPGVVSPFNSWGCFPLSKQSLLHPELLG